MDKISLSEIITQYSIAERDTNLLKSLLADMNPQNKLENNLICLAHSVGIPDNLKKKNFVSEQDMFNLTTMLEKTYGMAYSYAYYAVETWADLYGIKCAPMVVVTSGSNQTQATKYDENHYPGINEIVWENEDVQVTYKNMESLDMSKADSISSQFYMNYIFKNKSDKDIHIHLFDVSMNGIVFQEQNTLETIRAGKAKSIKGIFNLHSVQNIGFKSNDELEEFSFELAYAFSGQYFKYNEKVDSKVIKIKIEK